MADIISKREQPLLGRTDIQARVSFEGATPTRANVRKQVAKALGTKEEHIIIRTINTRFGTQEALIGAAEYKKIEDARAVEHKSRMAKHEKREEPKEEAAEEKKEETPTEAPAEETPAEEKKDE